MSHAKHGGDLSWQRIRRLVAKLYLEFANWLTSNGNVLQAANEVLIHLTTLACSACRAQLKVSHANGEGSSGTFVMKTVKKRIPIQCQKI